MKRLIYSFKALTFFLLLVFIFTGYIAHSQEYSNVLSTLDPIQSQHLQNIAEEPNPSIYIHQSNSLLCGGNNPIVAICDVNAIDRLYENNPLYNEIELIRIDIRNPQELANIFSLSHLTSFLSLQYVYLFFQYDACGSQASTCLPPIVSQFMNNEQPQNIKIIYRLDIIQ